MYLRLLFMFTLLQVLKYLFRSVVLHVDVEIGIKARKAVAIHFEVAEGVGQPCAIHFVV